MKQGRESACSSSPKKKQPSYLAYATPYDKPKTVTDLLQEMSGTGIGENSYAMSRNDRKRASSVAKSGSQTKDDILAS